MTNGEGLSPPLEPAAPHGAPTAPPDPGRPHVITAADPLPDDLRQALEGINGTPWPNSDPGGDAKGLNRKLERRKLSVILN